ncbi:hypothetical protein [Mesobacillus zeae]|nr:hypothetical protein [Mesobacillus zeae]
MEKKEPKSFPNVSLGGKLPREKSEVDSGQLRYGQEEKTESINRK